MLRESACGVEALATLFVSDLHLDASAPAMAALFGQFLSGAARDADALYILGDLFEVWIGDDDADPFRNAVCGKLRQLTAAGVPCFVMHGNRDFLLGSGFEQRTGCRLIDDPTLIDLYGRRVLLSHGDALCTQDRPYQQLRANVRRPRWQQRFLRLPLSTRLALADSARAGSRRHTGQTAAMIMDVTPTAVLSAMQACGAQTLIHGHTHRPDIHGLEVDHLPAQRIVLGAWHEQGSVLRWERHSHALEHYTGGPE